MKYTVIIICTTVIIMYYCNNCIKNKTHSKKIRQDKIKNKTNKR